MRHVDISADVADRLDAFEAKTGIAPSDVLECILADLPPSPLELLLDSLEQLTRYVSRTGGYMDPRDQQTLRHAKELLEQHGRKVT